MFWCKIWAWVNLCFGANMFSPFAGLPTSSMAFDATPSFSSADANLFRAKVGHGMGGTSVGYPLTELLFWDGKHSTDSLWFKIGEIH